MKVKATFRMPVIDSSRFQAKVHKTMSEAIAYGSFEWINAALRKIPVWSGASHATFLKLAKETGFHLAITPVARQRISLGESQGEGSLTADQSSGKYAFTYATTLEHLIFNEYQNANEGGDPNLFAQLIRPGPYGFQLAASEAFKKAVADVHLPSFLPYLKIKTRRVW